jgi:hypothetical protein
MKKHAAHEYDICEIHGQAFASREKCAEKWCQSDPRHQLNSWNPQPDQANPVLAATCPQL